MRCTAISPATFHPSSPSNRAILCATKPWTRAGAWRLSTEITRLASFSSLAIRIWTRGTRSAALSKYKEPSRAWCWRSLINQIIPGPYGWTWAGDWSEDGTDPYNLGKEAMLAWTLDRETMTGRDQFGHTVSLHPFMGVMGMPPDVPGIHSTAPPRPCGGNIDCKELVAGSTLYLPVSVPGALFSVGDGHAAQGDGEVSRTAIECPMDIVELTFRLRDDMHLTTPRANTPSGWIALAFHEDLNVATRVAINAMLDLIVEQHRVERAEAYALASVVVDMHITQIVNGVSGVHAILPHDAIR